MPILRDDPRDSFANRFRRQRQLSGMPPPFSASLPGAPGAVIGTAPTSAWESNRRQAEAMLANAPPLAPGTTSQQAFQHVARPAGGPLYGVGGSGGGGGITGGAGPLGIGSYLADNRGSADDLLAQLLVLTSLIRR